MNFKFIVIASMCVISLSNQSFKQEENTNETNTPLDSLVVNYLKKYDTPGLSIKVFKGENLYWSHNYGYLDLEKQLPMRSDAIMNGSYMGKQILNEETIVKMLTPQIEGNNVQGIGWKRIEYEDNVFWGHSGRDPGVRTHLYFHPETQTGIVLFQNNDDGYTIKLVADILNNLMNDKSNN